jgi:integrase
MATCKRWSRTVGTRRGNRIRIYQRSSSGNLQMAVWDPEKKRYKQVSLGHTDRERATREAAEMVRLRDAGEWIDSRSLTLGILVARYLAENTHARDGSLKTEHYRRGCERYANYLIGWFGADTPVVELTPERMAGYATVRRSGQINGRPVGATALHQDIKLLKSMMKWATGVYNNGRPLLDRNPLTGFAIPKTRNPIRPLIDAETVEKLMAVADRVSPLMPLLITLMDSTGRRLSSVLGLRWDDFDFEKRTITWRAELDKKRRTWVVPMPRHAEETLLKFRAEHPAIGSALVFPMLNDPTKPVTRHLASDWMHRAYRYAGIDRQKGGLWHPFRRKWATERKAYPVRDTAAAGGWEDLPTALMYQQPDEDTLRNVIDHPKSFKKRSQNG